MKDNNLKYVPSVPKTYEVRYVENKQSGLSLAARQKVVNRSGGNYMSFRTNIANPSYGPGIDNPNTKYCAESGCYEKIDDSLTYCSKHSGVVTSKERKEIAKELAKASEDLTSGSEIEFKREQKDSQGNYKSESLTVRKK